MAVTKEAPERKGLAHISVPIQLSRLKSAAEKGDWNKVENIGSDTISLEVGKYAVDKLVEAKEWARVEHLASGVFLKTAHDVSKYAREQFKKATPEDVDKAVEAKDWNVINAIFYDGSALVAKYDVDKLVEAKEWGSLERMAENRGYGQREAIREYAKEQFKKVTKDDVDKQVEIREWGPVTYIGKWGSKEVAEYAKEKLAQYEKGLI